MKTIQFSKLKGANVKTRSGVVLGNLHDVELDENSLRCINILVTPSSIVKKIIGSELIISVNDIIEIVDNNIIVSDMVSKDKGSKLIIEELSGNTSAQALNSQN